MINNTIALQARAPQIDFGAAQQRMGNTLAQIAQLKQADIVQKNALMKQAQDKALNDAYASSVGPNGTIDQAALIQKLSGAGAGSAIPGALKAISDQRQATTQANEANMKFMTMAVGHTLQSAVQNPTDETLMSAKQNLVRLGVNPADVDQELAPIMSMPVEQRGQALLQKILSDPNSKVAYEATLPKGTHVNLGGTTAFIDTNPLSPTYNQKISELSNTVSPNTIYQAAHPNLQHVEGQNGIYSFNPRTGTAAPVMVGNAPSSGGGAGIQPGQYGSYIENSAKQLNPGLVVSGRARTPERNAQVGGVPNSYHLTDNARDLQPAQGQTLDQLAASLAPLKQQGFDVMIERGKNHVHVEPGPGMHAQAGGAAPSGQGMQLQGKNAAKANEAASPEMAQLAQHMYNLIEDAHDKGHIPSNDKTWVANTEQAIRNYSQRIPGAVAQKTSLDKMSKTGHQIMQTILRSPGQAGPLRTVTAQNMFLQSVGADPSSSYEARLDAIRSFAAQHGIKIQERSRGGQYEAVDTSNPLLRD
jgi:hypothetical protein